MWLTGFRQSYVSPNKPFKENSLGWSDEEIFWKCTIQDLSVMDYCGAPDWNPVDSWVDSPEQECYRNVTNTLALEQQESVHGDDDICGDLSHPLRVQCLTPEIFHFCNPRGAMLGAYAFQLREWMDEFTRSRMRIYSSEEFFENPSAVLSDLEEFLGISRQPMDWEQALKDTPIFNMGLDHNRSGENSHFIRFQSSSSDYPPLPESVRSQLNTFFLPYLQHLHQLLRLSLWTK